MPWPIPIPAPTTFLNIFDFDAEKADSVIGFATPLYLSLLLLFIKNHKNRKRNEGETLNQLFFGITFVHLLIYFFRLSVADR